MSLAVAVISHQAHAMLRQGRFREVERLCAEVAEEIEPRISKASADELSAWGGMLMWASRAAVRNNRPEEAKTHLATAVAAAAPLEHEYRTPDDMTFGRATVALLGPENELVAGRPDKALQLSRNLSKEGLKSTNWYRHMLDVALASVRTSDADRATDILNGIRRNSPRWLRYQQPARDITKEILASRPRMPTEQQRVLAEFMNVEG